MILLPKPADQRGFTLVEMLIVLVLIGLVASLTLPKLGRLYEAVKFNFQLDDVMIQFAGLGEQARALGKGMAFSEYPPQDKKDAATLLALPEGWFARAQTPVTYLANGVCLGGQVQVGLGSEIFLFQLEPPFCRPGS